MNILSGDISGLVFERADRGDLGEFSLDSHMLSVLVELDGRRSLGSVAKKAGLDMGIVKGVILRLLKLKLIRPEGRRISVLGRDFFDYLNVQLSLALGPIADVLIEEAVTDLDHSKREFPRHRAAELVNLLAREIRREEKRIVFQQNMAKKIKEIEA
ncbi:MAG: hypothetical protein JSW12_03685 [Deltaproteobacteria bacterium]|nr:MAG: hypothetical protein JSW12_03685 [Deltaproteobacteria bacterium]